MAGQIGFCAPPTWLKLGGSICTMDGMWDGKPIGSKDGVQQSLRLSMDGEEGFKYAFKWWWLLPRIDRKGYVWMARGFGGWRLMLFPGRRTDGRCLRDEKSSNTQGGDRELISRILPASHTQSCSAMPCKLRTLRF
jgi:hypothetical protein